MTTSKPTIGLALGGGAARGWAHIGVIRALEEAGVKPDLVCGTSIGALVGAAYATGELDRFERWVVELGIREVVRFLDLSLSGGLLKGQRLVAFFRRTFDDRHIESLPLPFGAVATALASGAEVWLREGSVVEAVRASIALPALFTPANRDGDLLIDGGLVNPVPITLAKAMGAEVVIAVDLNSDLLGRHFRSGPRSDLPEVVESAKPELLRKPRSGFGQLLPARSTTTPTPSLLEVVATSLNIMQVRITRSRMAGDPADVVIAPRLAHLSLMEFHRGQEAIDAGRRAVASALPVLRDLGLVSSAEQNP
jgi:NTE family protein